MLFGGKGEDKEDTGSLMDTSINNAVIEYGFPAEFFLDTLCRCDTTGFCTSRHPIGLTAHCPPAYLPACVPARAHVVSYRSFCPGREGGRGDESVATSSIRRGIPSSVSPVDTHGHVFA